MKRIEMYPNYPSQRYLAEALCKEIHSMYVKTQNPSNMVHWQRLAHLQNMMEVVIKAGDQEIESFHNVHKQTFRSSF